MYNVQTLVKRLAFELAVLVRGWHYSVHLYVPIVTQGESSLARGSHCCPNCFLFLLPDHRLYIVKYICIYTHI